MSEPATMFPCWHCGRKVEEENNECPAHLERYGHKLRIEKLERAAASAFNLLAEVLDYEVEA